MYVNEQTGIRLSSLCLLSKVKHGLIMNCFELIFKQDT